MIQARPIYARLAGCIPFSGGAPGFAHPLFQEENNRNDWLSQETDEITHLVSGFRLFDTTDSSVWPLQDAPKARIGHPQIYVFFSETGKAHAGNIQELELILRKFMGSHPEHGGINLQISELIGTNDERRQARLRMRKAILASTGEMSAYRFYEGSILNSMLWASLVEKATSQDAARRILAVRSRAMVKINDGYDIEIDLSALDEKDYDKSAVPDIENALRDEVLYLKMAKIQQREQLASTARQRNPTAAKAETKEKVARRIILQMAAASRQEERVALLLSAVFEDVEIGSLVVRHYLKKEAKYASYVRQRLLHMLDERSNQPSLFGGTKTTPEENIILLKMVYREFSGSVANTRVILTYFLAKHLSRYPEARNYIRDVLQDSRSQYMLSFKDDILAQLME